MKIGPKKFDFKNSNYIMGILNVTPDSFSDGGEYTDLDVATEQALKMVAEGADIIDIGGESSRPGSEPVSEKEELSRTIPVIKKIRERSDIPISIDTTKAAVANEAITAGADMINDISSLQFDPEMADCVKEHQVPICLMHMRGRPKTMQQEVHYNDVITEITDWLDERIKFAEKAGIAPDKIIIDPGIGFGKLLEHNLTILKELHRFGKLGKPILIGPSRKSFIGQILDLPPEDRLEGTLASIAVGLQNGASIIRVHDVAPTHRFLKVFKTILSR